LLLEIRVIRRKSLKSLSAIGGMLPFSSAAIASRGASRAVTHYRSASPWIEARFDEAFARRARLAGAFTGSHGEP
jgi:hypothetical protein